MYSQYWIRRERYIRKIIGPARGFDFQSLIEAWNQSTVEFLGTLYLRGHEIVSVMID